MPSRLAIYHNARREERETATLSTCAQRSCRLPVPLGHCKEDSADLDTGTFKTPVRDRPQWGYCADTVVEAVVAVDGCV